MSSVLLREKRKHMTSGARGIKHSLEGAALGFYSSQNILKTIKVFRKLGDCAETVIAFPAKGNYQVSNIREILSSLICGEASGLMRLACMDTEPGLTAFLSRSQNYSLIKKTCPSRPTVCADT